MPLRPLTDLELAELNPPEPEAPRQEEAPPFFDPSVEMAPFQFRDPPTPAQPIQPGQDLSRYQLPPVGAEGFRGQERIPSRLRPVTADEAMEILNRADPSSVRLQEQPQPAFGAEQAQMLRRETEPLPPGLQRPPIDALAPRPTWERASTGRAVVDSLRTGAVGIRTSGLGISAQQDAALLESLDYIASGGTPRPRNPHDASFYGEDPATLQREREQIARRMGGTVGTMQDLDNTLEAETVAAPAAVQTMMAAGQRGDTRGVLDAIWSDPGNVIAFLGLSSLPYSAVTAAGGLAGGPAGVFAGSAMLEYGSSLTDRLREHWGIDTNNRDAVVTALSNPVILEDVRTFGSTRGGAIGLLDAAAFGGTASGFRQVAQAPRHSAMHTFREGLHEATLGTAREGAMGATGEALAQVATGQPLDPAQIAAEALGETITSPVTVGSAAVRGTIQGMQGAPAASSSPQTAPIASPTPQAANPANPANPAAPGVSGTTEPGTGPTGAGPEQGPEGFDPPPAQPPAPQSSDILELIRGALGSIDPDDRASLRDILARKIARGVPLTWQSVPSEITNKMDTASFAWLKQALSEDPQAILTAIDQLNGGQAPAQPSAPPAPPQPTEAEVQKQQLADILNDPTPLADMQAQAEANAAGATAAQQDALEEQAQAAGVPTVGEPSTITFADGSTEQGSVVAITQDSDGQPVVRIRMADGAETEIRPGDVHFSPAVRGTGTRESPVIADTPEAIRTAEQQVAPDPTPAQAEAENYRVGHIKLRGLDISIETAKGGIRTGPGWEVVMPAPYGRILGTRGADGDHLDVYLGDHAHDPESPIFVIDQFDPATGKFDEHKVMMGFASPDEALATYDAAFSDGSGPTRRHGIRSVQPNAFAKWLKGDLRFPFSEAGRHKQKLWNKAYVEAREREAAENAAAEAEANKPVEPTDNPLPNESSKVVNRFTTAKGSTYVLHEDGSTTRDKAARPEHPGESGPQERSTITYFVEKDHANRLALPSGKWRLAITPSELRVVWPNPKTGKWGSSPSSAAPYTMIPKVGMVPVEVWERQDLEGKEVFRRVHYGNPITEIRRPEEAAPAKKSRDDEINDAITKATEDAIAAATAPQEPKSELVQAMNLLAELEAERDAQGRITDARLEDRIRQLRERVRSLQPQPPKGGAPALKKPARSKEAIAADILSMLNDEVKSEPKASLFNEERYRGYVPLLREFAMQARHLVRSVGEFTTAIVRQIAQAAMKAGGDVANNIRAMVERLRVYVVRFVKDVQDGSISLAEDEEGSNDAEAPDGTVGTDEGAVPGTEFPSVPETTAPDGQTPAAPASDQPGSDDTGGQAGTGQPGSEPTEQDRPEPAVGEQRPGDAGGEGTGDAGGNLAPTATDFVIGPNTAYLPEGGPVGRARSNIAAIELAKKITAEKRPATAEEQAQLVKYVGWGGIPQIFDERNKSVTWSAMRDQLQGMLTKEQYEDARASTLNAHYTSREVVTGMWDAMRKIGFRGGKVLEPSVGTGNFIGMQPAEMKEHTKWVGTELDPVTGMIAGLLYPEQKIMVRGFEKFHPQHGSFDLVISNVPFGDFPVSVAEKELSQFQRPIHDYFLAKSILLTRPGGVVAIVTSRYTMDKQDPKLRQWVGERADLLGAIRLPRTAFEGNAGTSVTTDLLFFRRKIEDGVKEEGGNAFEESREIDTPTGRIHVNEYFAKNPQAMLGQMHAQGGQYGRNEGTLQAHPGADLARDLQAAIARFLPADAFRQPTKKPVVATHLTPQEPGSQQTHGRIILQAPEKAGDPEVVAVIGLDGKPVPWPTQTGKVADRMRSFVPVRDALADLLAGEEASKTDEELAPLRAKLNTTYDAFVKRHGPINLESISERPSRRPGGEPTISVRRVNIDSLRVDPEVWKTAGIEIYDRKTKEAKKAPIFTERRIFARKPVERVDSAMEALAASLTEKGKIDFDYMTKISGLDQKTLIGDLGDQLFVDPATGEHTLADLYLSGPVRKKLARAKDAAEVDPQYQRNVAALEKALPADLIASSNPLANEIQAPFGAAWIPAKYIQQFLSRSQPNVVAYRGQSRGAVRDVFDVLRLVPETGTWAVGAQRIFSADLDRYHTQYTTLQKIVKDTLNQITVVIRFKDAQGNTYIDKEETEAAQEAQNRLKRDWAEWLYSDDERRQAIQDLYNETQNDYVLPTFNSDLLLKRGQVFEYLRPYQRAAVWRIILTGNTLLYHFPGAGKTFTMVAAAMEQRRLGLVKKPAFAVPNHMLDQFRNEFLILYPNARVLVTTNQDMQKKNRKGWLQRASLQDWDAIIMGHSTFDRIMPESDRMERFIRDEIERLAEAISNAKAADNDKATVKQMEKAKKSLTAKLNKIQSGLAGRAEDEVKWGETGIDFLFLDESHYYKKIPFVTQLGNVRNIPNDMSQRALGLMAKIEGMNEKHPGRAIVSATGTAISNSMAEVWVNMRMTQPDLLREKGWHTFDGWARTFGQVVGKMETNPTGLGFKMRERFQEFVNVPELATAFRQTADIVTPEMVNIPRPNLAGGRAKVVAVKPSQLQKEITAALAMRAENLKRGGGDNMLSIVGEAKKAALDPRLLRDDASEADSAKLQAAADRIIAHYWYGGDMPRDASKRLEDGAIEPHDVRQLPLWTDIATVEQSGRVVVQESNSNGDMLPFDHRQGLLPLPTTTSLQVIFCDLGTPGNKRRKKGAGSTIDATAEDVTDTAGFFDDNEKPESEGGDDITVGQEEEEAAAAAANAEAEAATDDTGFNVYTALKNMLIDRGIPAHEIAFIHDAKTPFQKEFLFEKARSGAIRVLFGSTDKMGVGTNIQANAVALHHLDAPWRPSDVEQRDARVVRNGNRNKEVYLYRYVTQETFDAYLWQTLTIKSNFISQFLAGAKGKRIIEEQDIPLPDAETVLAIATGNPRMLQLVEKKRRLDTLDNLRALHARDQENARNYARYAGERLARRQAEEKRLLDVKQKFGPTETGEQKRALISFNGEAAASDQEALNKQFEEANKNLVRNVMIGFQTTRSVADSGVTIAGMPVQYLLQSSRTGAVREVQPVLETSDGPVFLGREIDITNKQVVDALPPGSLSNRVLTIISMIDDRIGRAQDDVAMEQRAVTAYEKQAEAEWDLQDEHDRVSKEVRDLEAELGPQGGGPGGAPSPAASKFRQAQDQAAAGGTLKEGLSKILADQVSRMTGGRAQFRTADGKWVNGKEGMTGLYDAGLITVALDFGQQSATADVNHEVVHALKDMGLFTREEWARLVQAARKWRRDLRVDALYPEASEERKVEEAIAEAFARWMDDKPAEGTEPVKNLFTRISEFFKRLARRLRQDVGWGHNVEDIWEKVASGEVGQREMDDATATRIVTQRLVQELGVDEARAKALTEEGMADYQKMVEEFSGPKASMFARMRSLRRYGRLSPEEQASIKVAEDLAAKDIHILQAQLQRPKELFARDPATKAVWTAADRAITNLHTWTKRFMDEFDSAWNRIPKDARAETSKLLFTGDAEEKVWTDADLKDMGASEAAARGYQDMREMFAKMGRFIDQHRRAMVPYLRKRRDWLTREIAKLSGVATKTASSLMARRNLLVERGKAGLEDPKIIKKQIDRIDGQLRDLVAANHGKEEVEEFDRMLAELAMVQGQIANTSIRNRKTGYVPHRFFGSWQLYEIVDTEDEDGEPATELRLIAGPNGFFLDRATAIEAAKKALAGNPEGRFLVRPKVASGMPGFPGTEMSDKSFWTLASNVAEQMGVEVHKGAEILREDGIAKPTAKRRSASFLKKREGIEGYSQDFEKIMRAHIVESSRYVVMDRFKHTAESALEKGGLSRHKPSRNMENMQRAVLAFMEDVYGHKQSFEAGIDRVLAKGSPLTAAATMAAASGATLAIAGASWPVWIGFGAFMGYGMYRAKRESSEYTTRGFLNYLDSVITHIKLGLVINWLSGVVNSTQTAINTYPVLGAKWTAEGMQAAVQAWAARNKPDSPNHRLWTVMQRTGVVSQLDYTEIPTDDIKSRESWGETAKRASLWMFRTAESANRATAFLGAYLQAQSEGRNEAQSIAYARKIMDFTQHRYDAAYKPAAARQQVLRPFLKFKNFVLQQSLFMVGLAKGNIPTTDGGVDMRTVPPQFWKAMAMVFLMGGALGIPGAGVADDVLRLIGDDYSPLLAFKEWGRVAAKNNPDMAWAIDAFIRGIPTFLGQDFSVRVGMGEKFIPNRLQDMAGPLVGTASRLAGLGNHEFAGLGDYLAAISTPLGRPFKVLEAEANGLPIWNAVRPEWWEALRDDRFRWINVNKGGRADITEENIRANPNLWFQLFAGTSPLALAQMYDQAELSRVLTAANKKAGDRLREGVRLALTRAHFDVRNQAYRDEVGRLLAEAEQGGYRPANPRATIAIIERDINKNRTARSTSSAPRAVRPRLEQARP